MKNLNMKYIIYIIKNGEVNIFYTISSFILFAFILILAIYIKESFSFTEHDAIMALFVAIQAITLIASIIVVVYQLTDTKKIARAEFIAGLNKSYVENKDYIHLYDCLHACWDGTCEYSNTCNPKDLTKDCTLPLPDSVALSYLTFFETIYLLQKDKLISFEALDDLFAYRFFLAVHSKFIQKTKLKPEPRNFKTIFCLEHKWLEYRKWQNKVGTMPVCDILLLKDLVDPELHRILIHE